MAVVVDSVAVPHTPNRPSIACRMDLRALPRTTKTVVGPIAMPDSAEPNMAAPPTVGHSTACLALFAMHPPW